MTNKTKGWLIILGAIVFLGLLRNIASTDPASAPVTKLTVTFLGYTNDSTGKQLAQFLASNTSATTLRLATAFVLPKVVTNGPYTIKPSTNSMCVLTEHQTKTFTLVKPANLSTWHVRILYCDWDWQQRFIARVRLTPLIRLVPRQWAAFHFDAAESTDLNQ